MCEEPSGGSLIGLKEGRNYPPSAESCGCGGSEHELRST